MASRVPGGSSVVKLLKGRLIRLFRLNLLKPELFQEAKLAFWRLRAQSVLVTPLVLRSA
jgi:hypothetical protein